MVKLSKLYTRQGDSGDTGLVGGARIRKTAPQVVAYGDIDELNCWIGVVRASLKESEGQNSFEKPLHDVQQTLFDIGAELATPTDSEWSPPSIVSDDNITTLEKAIDQWTADVPELKSFLLPGSSQLTSFVHVARSVCRRVERSVLTLHETHPIRPEIVTYLNRLSDWLFALTRIVAKQNSEEEILWKLE